MDWSKPCPKQFLLNELAILVSLVWRALTIWWEGALWRADVRYRSRTKLHCPFCGGSWHRDDSTINVPVRGGWYWKAKLCKHCGEWFFNVCEHKRIGRPDLSDRAPCLDCWDWVYAEEIEARKERRGLV